MSQTMEIQFQKDIEYILQGVLKILQDELGKDAIAYYEFDSSAQLLTTKINGDVFSIEFFLDPFLNSDRSCAPRSLQLLLPLTARRSG